MTYEEFKSLSNDSRSYNYLRSYEVEHEYCGEKYMKKTISIEDIDRINDFEDTEKIMISGLKQDTFEYFVEKYGRKIKYLSFHINKLIEDLSLLSGLPEIRFIQFFGNQRVTKLWDMSQNHKLEGLEILDFSRLKSLDGVQTAPNLKHLHFGDAVWATSVLTDLKPLLETKLESFGFSGKKIENDDISVYIKMPELKQADLGYGYYTTEEYAKIAALRPDISGEAFAPYYIHEHWDESRDRVRITGKRKPFLNETRDAEKIKAYEKKFYALIEKYKQEGRI
jgi:hypothetical protein